MEVVLAVLADYANVSQEGKLNIMGIFDIISSEKFPTVHPEMKLVVQFEASIAETGKTHDIEIQLMGPDGQKSFVVQGKLTIGEVKPGTLYKANNILNLRGAKFDAPGDFQFNVLVDNNVKRVVPLKVVQKS